MRKSLAKERRQKSFQYKAEKIYEPVKKLESAAREQERPYGKVHARAHPRSGL
jgi:hypothetical protein